MNSTNGEVRAIRRQWSFIFLAIVVCWVASIVFEHPTTTQGGVPQRVNECGSPRDNQGGTPSSVTCSVRNVTSGNTVLVWGTCAATTCTVSSTTQALTCPAAAKGVNGVWVVQGCYVVASSNYSDFNVTTTGSAGTNRAIGVFAREFVGLGAFDVACGSTGTSCSLTTTNANEWLDVGGVNGSVLDLLPHSGFNAQTYGASQSDVSGAAARSAVWYKLTTTTGSYTAQYDEIPCP